MNTLTFTKEQLDVIYYAVANYRISQQHTLDVHLEASKVTGYYNSKFCDSLRKDVSICDDIKELLIRDLLSHLGLKSDPK